MGEPASGFKGRKRPEEGREPGQEVTKLRQEVEGAKRAQARGLRACMREADRPSLK